MLRVVLDEQDHGRTITVDRSTEIRIALNENPTSGYRWQFDVSGDAMSATGPTYAPAAAGVGAGGTRILTLRAMQAGTVRVHARLQRDWERDAIQTYDMTITVSGAVA
jgi:inhibitor of cysteine peptidase